MATNKLRPQTSPLIQELLDAGFVRQSADGSTLVDRLGNSLSIGGGAGGPALDDLAARVAALESPPVNVVPPSISGLKTLGALLTASPGTWRGAPPPAFSYAWRRAGVAIPGAAASTYNVTADDQGTSLTVAVQGTTSVGTASATSAPYAIPAAITLMPLNTPLLFEGDSNTDTQYSIASWAKRAVLEAGSRYYIPAGGFLAGAGGTISGNNGNSMDARKDRAVALIQKMVAAYGLCVMYFQIGTNGAIGMTDEQAISDLANLVSLYRGAGARVYANTCPTYGGTGNTSQTFLAKLNTWIMTAGNVDGFVDVNTVITAADSNDATHYNTSGCGKVGALAGTFLKDRIVTTSVYDDGAAPIFASEFAGTGGTGENQVINGDLTSGWIFKNVYQKALTVTASKVQIDGHTFQRLKVDCGAEAALYSFEPQQQGDLVAAVGSYVELMATVRIVDGNGSYWLYNQSGGVQGGFPARDTLVNLPISVWGGPFIWRTYTPFDRTAANGKQAFAILVSMDANTSITFDIGRMRSVVRPA
jgi:hypothetical protein